jgi:hypothetical protein
MASVAAVIIVTVLLAAVRVAAQAPGATPTRFVIPTSTYDPPKTPWGDPDLQGVYENHSIIPMERPANLAGKKTLTDAELAAFASTRGAGIESLCAANDERCRNASVAQLDNVGSYNGFWTPRDYVKDNRTSLIEDPPDGRIPPMTAQAIAIREAYLRAHPPSNEGAGGNVDIRHWEDFDISSRCIAHQVPTGIMGYNSASYLMQSPGWVMIAQERSNTRIIPLDGRRHLGKGMGSWLGDSRGHWQGNTLVVETTNYSNKQSGGGVGASVPAGIPFGNIRLVEHFVPVSANRIHYYATLEDSKTWTRSWTFMQPWEKDRVPGYNDTAGTGVDGRHRSSYQIYEFACHEGNESVGNSIRGTLYKSRAADTEKPPTAELVAALIGRTEADVRARLGDPLDIRGPRWRYRTTSDVVQLYVFVEGGTVVRVRPDDLRLDEVVKTR